jgi:hypothetical protein
MMKLGRLRDSVGMVELEGWSDSVGMMELGRLMDSVGMVELVSLTDSVGLVVPAVTRFIANSGNIRVFANFAWVVYTSGWPCIFF